MKVPDYRDIQKIYEQAPYYVNGVSLGYRKVSSLSTSELAIIFHIDRKVPPELLHKSEIIPPTIDVSGTIFPTDVVESIDSSIAACSSPNSEGAKSLRSYKEKLSGGLMIASTFSCGVDEYSNSLENIFLLPRMTGTFGGIFLDKKTNTLVGLTAGHILSKNMVLNPERVIEETAGFAPNVYNLLEKLQLPLVEVSEITGDSVTGLPASLINKKSYRDVGGQSLKTYSQEVFQFQEFNRINTTVHSIGAPKKYEPLFLSGPNNYIDCGLIGLHKNRISLPESLGIFGEATTIGMPFATDAEINACFLSRNKIYSVGQASGPKTSSCALVIDEVSVQKEIGNYYHYSNNKTSIVFSDLIAVRHSGFNDKPFLLGDSGSLIYALIGGTPKILGMIFAIDKNTGYACRITRIASAMNLEPVTYVDGQNYYVDKIENPIIIQKAHDFPAKTFASGEDYFSQVGLRANEQDGFLLGSPRSFDDTTSLKDLSVKFDVGECSYENSQEFITRNLSSDGSTFFNGGFNVRITGRTLNYKDQNVSVDTVKIDYILRSESSKAFVERGSVITDKYGSFSITSSNLLSGNYGCLIFEIINAKKILWSFNYKESDKFLRFGCQSPNDPNPDPPPGPSPSPTPSPTPSPSPTPTPSPTPAGGGCKTAASSSSSSTTIKKCRPILKQRTVNIEFTGKSESCGTDDNGNPIKEFCEREKLPTTTTDLVTDSDLSWYGSSYDGKDTCTGLLLDASPGYNASIVIGASSSERLQSPIQKECYGGTGNRTKYPSMKASYLNKYTSTFQTIVWNSTGAVAGDFTYFVSKNDISIGVPQSVIDSVRQSGTGHILVNLTASQTIEGLEEIYEAVKKGCCGLEQCLKYTNTITKTLDSDYRPVKVCTGQVNDQCSKTYINSIPKDTNGTMYSWTNDFFGNPCFTDISLAYACSDDEAPFVWTALSKSASDTYALVVKNIDSSGLTDLEQCQLEKALNGSKSGTSQVCISSRLEGDGQGRTRQECRLSDDPQDPKYNEKVAGFWVKAAYDNKTIDLKYKGTLAMPQFVCSACMTICPGGDGKRLIHKVELNRCCYSDPGSSSSSSSCTAAEQITIAFISNCDINPKQKYSSDDVIYKLISSDFTNAQREGYWYINNVTEITVVGGCPCVECENNGGTVVPTTTSDPCHETLLPNDNSRGLGFSPDFYFRNEIPMASAFPNDPNMTSYKSCGLVFEAWWPADLYECDGTTFVKTVYFHMASDDYQFLTYWGAGEEAEELYPGSPSYPDNQGWIVSFTDGGTAQTEGILKYSSVNGGLTATQPSSNVISSLTAGCTGSGCNDMLIANAEIDIGMVLEDMLSEI